MRLTSCLFQAKRNLSDDPRYDAVGSSSLREELFNTFLKAQGANISVQDSAAKQDPIEHEEGAIDDDGQRKRHEKKERAVKEREDKVKAERKRVETGINRSRHGLDKEEGDRAFRCAFLMLHLNQLLVALTKCCLICRTLLTDAIRDPQVRILLLFGQLLTNIFLDYMGRRSSPAPD